MNKETTTESYQRNRRYPTLIVCAETTFYILKKFWTEEGFITNSTRTLWWYI